MLSCLSVSIQINLPITIQFKELEKAKSSNQGKSRGINTKCLGLIEFYIAPLFPDEGDHLNDNEKQGMLVAGLLQVFEQPLCHKSA